ncbi:MAG: glycosyltransferase [Planctomycetaceae bacterium]
MRILHVIHSVDPRSGGPSHAIRELVRAQSAAGHEVALLATTVQSGEPWAATNDYVCRIAAEACFLQTELKLAGAYGRRPPWSRFAYSPESRRWLHERLQCERTRPDVIHIHGIFSHVTTLAARLAHRDQIPYILRPTGALDATCFQSGRKHLKQLFARLVLQRDLERAAWVHATSAAEADALGHWVAPERIRVVPLGVAVPTLDRAQAAEVLLQRYPALRGRKVVLFMSRIAPKKRPELLAEAVTLLRDELPEIALLIAGHDAGGMATLKEAIARRRLENHVMLAGFLEGLEKRSALAIADVFALPSLDENFGVAVVEAMAHGVPVLVTRGVASHTFVDDSGCGATVDDSVAAVAQGLKTLLAADRNDLGNRGREYAARRLAWPAIVSQLDELYRTGQERQAKRPLIASGQPSLT